MKSTACFLRPYSGCREGYQRSLSAVARLQRFDRQGNTVKMHFHLYLEWLKLCFDAVLLFSLRFVIWPKSKSLFSPFHRRKMKICQRWPLPHPECKIDNDVLNLLSTYGRIVVISNSTITLQFNGLCGTSQYRRWATGVSDPGLHVLLEVFYLFLYSLYLNVLSQQTFLWFIRSSRDTTSHTKLLHSGCMALSLWWGPSKGFLIRRCLWTKPENTRCSAQTDRHMSPFCLWVRVLFDYHHKMVSGPQFYNVDFIFSLYSAWRSSKVA